MYEFGAEEVEAASRVLQSGNMFRYMEGSNEASLFEVELAQRMRAGRALMTSSGTAALITGLGALGIGPGDEVIIPAYGFVADVIAVLAVGAKPVVAEIDSTLGMDSKDLPNKFTERTRAILPVHMNGFVADLDPILRFADDHGVPVIEDACQAIGATYRGRNVGTLGRAGAFSFNQAKIITAGEGGALLTDDEDLQARAFILHDPSCVFDLPNIRQPAFGGFAFRVTEYAAAIMRVQLSRLDSILARLAANRERLSSAIAAVSDVEHIPLPDPAGIVGNHVAYILDNAKQASSLVDRIRSVTSLYAFQGNVNGHSFGEWSMLHDRRGSHSAKGNPLAEPALVQGPDDCPASRDLLGRIILVGYGVDVADKQIEAIASCFAA